MPADEAATTDASHAIPHLLDGFLKLPGKKSAQVDVDEATTPWRVTSEPDAELFVGSCFKTFVLAAYLQEVEAGRLDESEQLAVDDSVRSLVSPVLQNLTGTTQARSALEAMIAHSDNTATDVAMKRVTPARVRQFISDAGLKKARIPDSTRRLFSYIAGAPQGEDLGLEGDEGRRRKRDARHLEISARSQRRRVDGRAGLRVRRLLQARADRRVTSRSRRRSPSSSASRPWPTPSPWSCRPIRSPT